MKSYGTGFVTGNVEPVTYQEYGSDERHSDAPYDPLAYAHETISELSQHPDFIESGITHGYDMSDTSSDDYLYHLSATTQEYVVDNREYFVDNFGKETLKSIELFGIAPYALRQQALLDARNEGAYLPDDVYNHAMDTVVQFNHTMYQLVEQNPATRLSYLTQEIATTVSEYDARPHDASVEAAERIARGVRSEYAFKTVVEESGLLSLKHGTVEQDRKGIDFIITLPNSKTINMDIKSSHAAVENKAQGQEITPNSPFVKRGDSWVYYPLLKNTMFEDGSFNLTQAAKDEFTMPILGNIQKIANTL